MWKQQVQGNNWGKGEEWQEWGWERKWEARKESGRSGSGQFGEWQPGRIEFG